MGKRGPQGEPAEVVLLKSQTNQLKRAANSGRLAAIRHADKLPVIDRDTPNELKRVLTRDEWRQRIVDSVAGVGSIRVSDEPLLYITCGILHRLQKMDLQSDDKIEYDEAGNSKIPAETSLYLKYVSQASKLLGMLGLTPATRARIFADIGSGMKDTSQAYDWSRRDD